MAVFQIVLLLVAAALIGACGDTAKNLTGINNEPAPSGDASGTDASAAGATSTDFAASSGPSRESSACSDGGTRWCPAGLGVCREGEQTCASGAWDPCMPKNMGRRETCDGDDNDCDGAVDEGCECVDGSARGCGTSLGPCERGTQSCQNGAWTDCEGGVQPAPDVCDGVDNDCDGVIDPGCECDEGAQRDCGLDVGACTTGIQSCLHGRWQQCEGAGVGEAETCDGQDNDCDGVIDNGFDLAQPCSSQGSCPQSRSCAADGRSTICENDERLFGDERCDGIDNDCDGLVDRVVDNGELRSVCTCNAQTLAIGKATSFALDGNENLCAATACTADKPRRLQVDATCYPECETDSDPDKDGWGYENGATCLVADSMRGRDAKPCPDDPIPLGMSISYCLDCSGAGNPPFAECQSVPRYDLSAFGRGELWLKVEYSFISTGAAGIPINLWFDAGKKRRKHLPLVRVGDLPFNRATRLFRAQEACFAPLDVFGNTCPAAAPTCAQCGPSERCGAPAACGGYDLSNASLEVAAEFCTAGTGQQSGTVIVHQVELVEPQCADGG